MRPSRRFNSLFCFPGQLPCNLPTLTIAQNLLTTMRRHWHHSRFVLALVARSLVSFVVFPAVFSSLSFSLSPLILSPATPEIILHTPTYSSSTAFLSLVPSVFCVFSLLVERDTSGRKKRAWTKKGSRLCSWITYFLTCRFFTLCSNCFRLFCSCIVMTEGQESQ